MRIRGAVVAVLGWCGAAGAQVSFTELLINPPQAEDQGHEAIELQGPAGMPLNGYWLIVIEGDGSAVRGEIDQKIDLSAMVIGGNGLLLLRDSSVVLSPAPAAGTKVVVHDFDPDIENGTNTFVVGFGVFPYEVGDDLDLDNNGTIDEPIVGFTATDAVSFIDTPSADAEYADDFGGEALGVHPGYVPEALYRVLDASGKPKSWAGGRIDGTNPGPYPWESEWHFGWTPLGFPDPSGMTLDLGSINLKVEGAECYADCDEDGALSIDDFICYQTLFALGFSAADCDGDAFLSIDDFICFQTFFAIGCP
jgi:hypothetical protein